MAGGHAIKPAVFLRAIIAEIDRRDRLLRLVAQAGFEKASREDNEWVTRSEVTQAVADALDRLPSPGLGKEIRDVLREAGWLDRKYEGIWQWRARRIKLRA